MKYLTLADSCENILGNMIATPTFESILLDKEQPVVGIDEKGIFFFVNNQFELVYGWAKEDLLGDVITKIIPAHMHDAHNFGFSRFLATETPRILQQPLLLPTLCKDGSIIQSEHFIVGKKHNDTWKFAAILKPPLS